MSDTDFGTTCCFRPPSTAVKSTDMHEQEAGQSGAQVPEEDSNSVTCQLNKSLIHISVGVFSGTADDQADQNLAAMTVFNVLNDSQPAVGDHLQLSRSSGLTDRTLSEWTVRQTAGSLQQVVTPSLQASWTVTSVLGPGFDPFLLLIALVAMALCMVGVLATVYWLRKGHKMDDNDPKKWTVTNRGRLYSEQPYV
ncbi:hypothetical protein BaRGS_00013064 [Batillaria attramentaria]|uniref:Uncharacterized protein n=1 Tax=Batillaria attramentaria TaxID=370345 RepID=A0ABD0L836_9CAEN